jgi:transcription elongation GreA/GreB family factor
MLFLVLGFLDYPEQRDSERSFSAPLISIPVALSRRESGGNQMFSLQYTGDDVSENLSLREKLKTDHSLILPGLTEDETDVEAHFSEIRDIIKDRPGFTLRRRTSLCLLSFTNMLLVRDLDPAKWPMVGGKHSFLDHPIVREIFQGADEQPDADAGWGIAPEHDVENGPGARIPLVFDADSSQHSALVDVLAQHKNVVIEGPPGTGKSQTITNLIAASLAGGKKVLFVAEKLAALEVVKARLTRAGLDPFLLELHSNKTNKKRVLEELAKRVDYRPSSLSDLPRKLQELENYRNDLRDYRDLINSVTHNAFGKTLHQIMWRSERYRMSLSIDHRPLMQRVVPGAPEMSELELSRRMDCLRYLGDQYRQISGFDADCPFWGFFPDPIVPGEEIRLRQIFLASREWAERFVQSVCDHGAVLGNRTFGLTLDEAATQLQALEDLSARADDKLPLHLIPLLFRADKTGLRAQRRLEAFSAQTERYRDLAPVVAQAIHSEDAVTRDRLDAFRTLERTATPFGVALQTQVEMRELCSRLLDECERLETALAAIDACCGQIGIPFDGSRSRLALLAELARTIAEVPTELLHLQSEELTREGSHEAVVTLARLEREWTALASDLDALYLDALPPEGTLKQAVLTFREGEAWYRIFQTRWRAAIATHKSLQRTKRRVAARHRRAELERVIELLQVKERWKADPAWPQYVGCAVPAEPVPLDGYLALAAWNRSVKLLLEDLDTPVVAPAELTPENARALRRTFREFGTHLAAATCALGTIDGLLPGLSDSPGGNSAGRCAEIATAFARAIVAQIPWLEENALPDAPLAAFCQACEAALERRTIVRAIDDDAEVQGVLGNHFAGIDTKIGEVLETLVFGQNLQNYPLPDQVVSKLRAGHPVDVAQQISAVLSQVLEGLQNARRFEADLAAFGAFDLNSWLGTRADGDLRSFATALIERAEASADKVDELVPWSLYLARRKEAQELGLGEFAALLETKQVPAADIDAAYAYCTCATILREAFRDIPQLGRFSGLKHHQVREEFRRLDREIIDSRGKAIAVNAHQNTRLPPGRNGTRVDDKTEMVLLNLLMRQQRPRMPVRKILSRAGRAVQALKPCFMMGPQAVAQYLTPGAISFDLVIMDEASQLRPEEAIGAIARGAQLVVVGDSRQLPPTSFFSRMSETPDDAEQYTTTYAESILDVCASHFRPPRALRWHYRSQHHSLIAFSNRNFYRGNLIIFPSPYHQNSQLGIHATYLADAVYDNQTNVREARRVTDAVAEHIKTRHDDSLGVVTLNIKQRDLIAEVVDERLRNVPGADEYREKWAAEGQPLFVKNLENVQGDERDAIIISTTFGKPPNAAAVRQNFGPISRQGGWRRLNVLFTRARKSIAIYTSMRPEDIVVDPTTPEGTKALRDYLEYARSGMLTVAEDNGLEPDSDFEVAVIDVLRARGYEVTPQLGVAGYRIDIAVKHPDVSGAYLAAIECDGASYHSGLSVRDRDRIRQEILESLGWRRRIWRIWSTDWFRAPRQETEKLISFLEGIRRSWRPEHAARKSWTEEAVPSAAAATCVAETTDRVAAADRQLVLDEMLKTDDDVEIEVGDLVRYIDVLKPDDVMSVRITNRPSDLMNGLISESTPLAQALLGALAGDEVPLHLPGASRRLFRVISISKAEVAIAA